MARKKVRVDQSACIGCSTCAGVYPDDYVMNDAGLAEAVTGEADEESIGICPVSAIVEE